MTLTLSGIEEAPVASEPQKQEAAAQVAQAPAPAAPEPKKGRVLNAPYNPLKVTKSPPGYTPRWVWRDEMNVEKRLEQGFVFCNRETGLPIEGATRSDVPGQGAWVRRDMVLMAIPDETRAAILGEAAQRNEFQTRGIKSRLQNEMDQRAGGGVAARATGQIVIG